MAAKKAKQPEWLDLLTTMGRIRKKFRPAIYLDSSVAIDYIMAEGIAEKQRVNKDHDSRESYWQNEERYDFLLKLLKPERRLKVVAQFRNRAIDLWMARQPAPCLVVTPLVLLEIAEWQADMVLRGWAAWSSGVKTLERRGRKDVGALLKKCLTRWQEMDGKAGNEEKQRDSGLDSFVLEARFAAGYARSHELAGVRYADMKGLDLPVQIADGWPAVLAFMQIGMADIIHLATALHLGCDYFASFDSDFARAKDVIEGETDIKVLLNSKEIIEVLG